MAPPCRAQMPMSLPAAPQPNWIDTDELLHKIFTKKQQHEYAHRQQLQWSDAKHNNKASPGPAPYFENSTQRSVVVAVGRTAKLHCRVRNLGDRAVTWIRQRDLHILTIGVMTYTNDQRFEALHCDDSDEWLLKITSVQLRDTGVYECQVSSEPKISQAFKLHALVAKAKILANPELVFQSGSDINLTCIDEEAPSPPSYIYWYKDGELINYSQRGGINVLTERLTKTSKLLIARVVPSDSGNYTCLPSNSNSDSVYVHVIKSEHPAAMQHERAMALQRPHLFLSLLIVMSLQVR
ncbi:hemicentin-1-like [Anastrepha obliqua]|uniref:hemicentin-1-like n=1 Tax=Anastrepha obliqua TaxID=95512 RepID=UPI0024099BF1|nr:hemicentin-1-like [Anastrepha obliqua]